jgi:ubiquinone/menaquinone biosynthesis C-methylase UbiE
MSHNMAAIPHQTPATNLQTSPDHPDLLQRERLRVEDAYRRRQLWEAASDLYAPWNPATILATAQRKRMAALLMKELGVFPPHGARCLEVGSGCRGWLGDLIDWGVREVDLHGIDLDPRRIAQARDALPSADLRVGDATSLPWDDGSFSLVVASTLFTSILEPAARWRAAREIVRVLAPGGCLLWYDFAVNNPRNPDVRRVSRDELRRLFPELRGRVQSCTLAPPLARRLVTHASWTWAVAAGLEAVRVFHTHLLAILVKPNSQETRPT